MNNNKILEEMNQQVAKIGAKLMLLVNAGSHAYGIAEEDSDIDVRGIYYAPNDLLFCLDSKTNLSGFLKIDGTVLDYSLFSFPEFIRLAMKNNINILEWIFVNEKDVLYADKQGKVLLDNNTLFLSKEIYPKTLGICKGYKREFDKALENKDEAKLGKQMAHIVRVHEMAIEALNTKRMQVYQFRSIPLLKAIRRGKYIKPGCDVDVLYYALLEDLHYRLEDAYKSSKLPEKIEKMQLKPLFDEMKQILIQEFQKDMSN